MKPWLLLLAVVLACHPQPIPAPQPGARRLAARFVLTGKVIAAMVGDSLAVPHTVLLGADGRATRLVVRGWSPPGQAIGQGHTITAWCHREGADTIADSLWRVPP